MSLLRHGWSRPFSSGRGRGGRRWRVLLAVVVLVAVAGCVVDLGTLGGETATATDINDRGVVVGWSTMAHDERPHAFRKLPGHPMQDLNGSFLESRALAVNGSGVVVGYASEAEGESHAVMWDRRGRPHDLGAGPSSIANDINDRGTIVGVGPDVGPFVRDPDSGDLERLPRPPDAPGGISSGAEPKAINEDGLIVGQVWVYPSGHGAVWAADTHELTVLPEPTRPGPGRTSTAATDVNADGTVVGSGLGVALLWQAGTHEIVEITPLGVFGEAHGINDRGQVVGVISGEGSQPFRWDLRTRRRVDLEDPYGFGATASKINEAGWVAGTAFTGSASPGVPAPSHAVVFTPGPGRGS